MRQDIRLKRLFGPAVGGSWGLEPGEGDEDALCIRGTDFDVVRLRVDVSRAPTRGYDSAEIRTRGAVSGDLIIEKSGGGEEQPVGRAVLWEGADIVMPTNFAARLRVNSQTEARYATYLLASMWSDGRTRAAIKQTTGIQNLDLQALLDQRISRPPLDVQLAIADYLDRETARLDALIAVKRDMMKLLEEHWQVVMHDAAAGRLIRDVGSHRATSVPWLTEVPTHWREGHLKLVAQLGTGHTPSRAHPEWWIALTIPWITTGEVTQMRSDRTEYITETREQISAVGMANSSAVLHPAGTVVLCRTASAGYSAIMGRAMATSQDFATWTCGPLLRPRFLLLCLRAMRQDLLGRLAMGSTHKTIYMPDIESIKVPIPPVGEQDGLVEAAYSEQRKLDECAMRLGAQLDLLQEHRQTLITAAVTGQLDIPEAA